MDVVRLQISLQTPSEAATTKPVDAHVVLNLHGVAEPGCHPTETDEVVVDRQPYRITMVN